jgi:anti-sigma regulatory factor (Ser/Thr protein kinase)
MTTDSSRVELLLPQDDRLTAAIDAVVAHAGERAGLSRREQLELARAAAEACEETFYAVGRSGNPNPTLRVLVSDFPNRVEVSIEDSAGAHSLAGSDNLSGSPSEEPDPRAATRHGLHVDRLHHEIREGRPRTTLVKHHESAKAERDR